MKICQLLNNINIMLSNKEQNFVDRYSNINLNNLNEHDTWLAQTLVRKGIYDISKDNILIKKIK